MRVATKTVYDFVKYNLSRITEDLNHANQVVSTGKRIVNLSDDPVGLVHSLEIKSTLASIDQVGRNIDLGKSWLVAAEGALGNVQNLISDTKALCVEMASATKSSADRQTAAEIVQNSLNEIITLANSQVGGRYIFAGTETDTLPFEQDGSYNGNDNPFAIKTASNSATRIGSDGEAIFGDLLSDLTDLIADLQGDDIDGIRSSMGILDGHFDDMSANISTIGTKMNGMEMKEGILQEMTISNTDRLSQIEDADIAEAVMNLKAVEVAYQAALASSAAIMELSLVDYLK
jgi:flagellar hook-associated protein 3 FlgL